MFTIDFKKSLLCAGVAAALSAPVSAFELGEFNGTTFAFGGYIKSEGVYYDPENGDSSFDAHGKQSRFNFKASREEEGHDLTAFIEGDFYGTDSKAWRMRHAYVQIDNIKIGQTWGGHWLNVKGADLIDFSDGGRGLLSKDYPRPAALVRYQDKTIAFTVQDPVNTDADIPDMAFLYNLSPSTSVGIVGRQIENDDFTGGVAFAGKYALGKGDIRINAHYGEGLAAYTGVGVGGKTNTDLEDGDAVSQAALNVAYRHMFANDLRGTVSYTQAVVDDTADTTYTGTHVNLIHNITSSLEVGVEWRMYDTDSTVDSTDKEIEIMAKYSF